MILRILGAPYRAADLMIEGSFLLGLLGGRVVGPLGGSIISLPAFMHREWLSMPVAATAGLVGGFIRQFLPNTEDIWRLGPYTFMSTPRWMVRLFRERVSRGKCCPWARASFLNWPARRSDRHETAVAVLFGCGKSWGIALVLLSTVMAVAVPMKIWSNTRMEMNLEQHQQLLLKARMDALTAQINPHFLFNTLNTVSSLIRYDPDMARGVVIKLEQYFAQAAAEARNVCALAGRAGFYRRLPGHRGGAVWARQSGDSQTVDAATLDAFVPSMLLQPIVENALKHGLAARLGGGSLPFAPRSQAATDYRHRRQRRRDPQGTHGAGI